MRRLLLLAPLLLAGCGVPSFLITPVASPTKLQEKVVERGNRDKIALIPIEGVLASQSPRGLFGGGENGVSLLKQQLDRAAEDDRVRAVVLRINSPGGTVVASDTMYELVKTFRRQTNKPVVVFAGDLCASGGYYIACAADEIVATPTSLVGSIGVIFQSFEVSDLLARWGVKPSAIKSGTYKDIASPFKPLAQGDRDILQGIVDENYARFVNVVKQGRGVDLAARPELIDGRIFSGETAAQNGLVNRLGGLDVAIERAKELAKADRAKVIFYRRSTEASGTIYASAPALAPQANLTQVALPEEISPLPGGFYYLWRP